MGDTMYVRKKHPYIFINVGKTYNFLDIEVVKRLECRINKADLLRINVVDKNNLACMAMIEKIKKERLVTRLIQHGNGNYFDLICKGLQDFSLGDKALF